MFDKTYIDNFSEQSIIILKCFHIKSPKVSWPTFVWPTDNWPTATGLTQIVGPRQNTRTWFHSDQLILNVSQLMVSAKWQSTNLQSTKRRRTTKTERASPSFEFATPENCRFCFHRLTFWRRSKKIRNSFLHTRNDCTSWTLPLFAGLTEFILE